MASFVITKRSARENESRTLNTAVPKGAPLGAHATNADEFAPATGTNFLGFASRAVTAGGPDTVDYLLPGRSVDDFPFKVGDKVTAEFADQVRVAGANLVQQTTGTAGDLSPTTAVGTLVSFAAGKFYAAQAGDVPLFTLTAHCGTDDDGDDIYEFTKL